MFKDSDSSNSKVPSEGRDEMRTATVADETKIDNLIPSLEF